MKKRIIAALCSICLVFVCLTGCNTAKEETSKEKTATAGKTVIATTYAVYDWVKNVIGDSSGITLKYLVDSNVDLHSYQPSADDIIEYQSADLIICIGGESEEWISQLSLDNTKVVSLINYVSAKEEEIIEGMQGEEPEESEQEDEGPEYDEHIWLSLINAKACVNTIEEKLSEIDSNNEANYKANAENYINQLDTLDAEYKKAAEIATVKTLLFGDRFPFRYLIDDYGLSYYAAFIGCSAESEASFETIAFLAEKVDELGLKVICVISQDHEIANSIINTTKSKDQTIVEFNSMQSISNNEADSLSYISIMEGNLTAFKTALGE